MIVDQLVLDAEQLIIASFQEDLEEEDEVEEDAEVNLEKVEEEMAAEYSEEEEDEILHIDEYSGITLHPGLVFRIVVFQKFSGKPVNLVSPPSTVCIQ